MFRLHYDEDGVNHNTYAAKTCGAEPENSGPDFAFVKTVQTQVAQQNAKGKSDPFVVFTFSGHSASFSIPQI